MGCGCCVCATHCRNRSVDAMTPVRYLKITPNTYHITADKFFDITECQFCGGTHHVWKKTFGFAKNSYAAQGVGWTQTCWSCKKTISAIHTDDFAK